MGTERVCVSGKGLVVHGRSCGRVVVELNGQSSRGGCVQLFCCQCCCLVWADCFLSIVVSVVMIVLSDTFDVLEGCCQGGVHVRVLPLSG